jgi:hypothetical protein
MTRFLFHQALTASVRNSGYIVLYGGMSGDLESSFATWELALRKVNITGYWVTPDIAEMSPQQKRDRAAEVRLENETRISDVET